MGFEYVIARLKAMRGRFVDEAELESIAGGRDAQSTAMLLERSLFGEGLKDWGRVTSAKLLAAVENGRLIATQKAAALVRENLPRHFGLIFSRQEMEQIKTAARRLRLAAPFLDDRPVLLELSETPGWVGEWTKYRGVEGLKSALSRIRHPLADGVDPNLYGVKFELAMERFYFGVYLAERRGLAAEAWGYFADMNDMTNLHAARLADGRGTASIEDFFLAGPGRMGPKDFSMLCAASDAEFHARAGRLTGLKIIYRQGMAGFAQSLCGELLVRWRVNAIVNPLGALEILVFLEELNAQAANLKIAVNAGAEPGVDIEPRLYFSRRKAA